MTSSYAQSPVIRMIRWMISSLTAHHLQGFLDAEPSFALRIADEGIADRIESRPPREHLGVGDLRAAGSQLDGLSLDHGRHVRSQRTGRSQGSRGLVNRSLTDNGSCPVVSFGVLVDGDTGCRTRSFFGAG